MSQSYWQADCLPIVDAAQDSAENWARVATFVILTIRQMFFLMPAQMQDVLSNGRDAIALFGFKQNGYDFIQENKDSLWTRSRECEQGAITLDDLILSYLAIPGLGIVKSSFLAQLTVGEGACIDAHNLRVLGLGETAFRTPKRLTVGSLRKRIAAYREIWSASGTSETWWDLWCDGLAARFPARYGNGAAVSKLHRVAIGE
jgi:hypothetical protein